MGKKAVDLKATRRQLWSLLVPESNFLAVVVIYGVTISLLTLAVPIAVQTLINTIANIGSMRAVYILAFTLFLLLLASGVLSALRMWVVERYERHVYARLTAEMSYRVIRAPHSFFEGRLNTGITHRYFDIMVLKKNVPRLVVDGFSLVLQMIVGFTLVSFYHPSLFLFNGILVVIIYAIWRIWSSGAKLTAIELSRDKYEMSKWLADLEVAHEFFKSSRHIELAAAKTEENTRRFIASHRKHFTYTYSQALMFLLLYALGSSTLLALGGYLVNLGQLSIGQLVAAELIMASIFLGLSRFVTFLKYYYELYGAADKISEVMDIPQEPEAVKQGSSPINGSLRFNNVVISRGESRCEIDLEIAAGEKLCIKASSAWIQRKMLNALRYHEPLDNGWVSLDGTTILDLDLYELRQSIQSIDRSLFVECTIREYLQLASPEAGTDQIMSVLQAVNLWRVINALPEGLDTRMSALGAPLQSIEVLMLKLAAALLSQPKVLVLNQRFDTIVGDAKNDLIALLKAQPCTVLYFTSEPGTDLFDKCIELTAQDHASDSVSQAGTTHE